MIKKKKDLDHKYQITMYTNIQTHFYTPTELFKANYVRFSFATEAAVVNVSPRAAAQSTFSL